MQSYMDEASADLDHNRPKDDDDTKEVTIMEEIGMYENPFKEIPDRCPSCKNTNIHDTVQTVSVRDDGTTLRWCWCADCGRDIAVKREED